MKGVGFLTVDAIGRQNYQALNDPMRISGCISHLMESAMKEEGHLYLERTVLIQRAYTMLNKDLLYQAVTETDIQRVLYRLVMQGSIVVDGERVYVKKQYEEENQTASMIARRLLVQGEAYEIDKELEEAEAALAITLTERQRQAVRMVVQSQISIITGRPGTGKTTDVNVTLENDAKIRRSHGGRRGPTDPAARRMAGRTGQEDASSLPMALGLLVDSADYESAV